MILILVVSNYPTFFPFFAYTAPQANNFWTAYIVLKLATQFLFPFFNSQYFTFVIFVFLTDIHHHMSFVWINIFVIEKKASLKSSKKICIINAIFLWRVVKECWNRLFFIFFSTQYISMFPLTLEKIFD